MPAALPARRNGTASEGLQVNLDLRWLNISTYCTMRRKLIEGKSGRRLEEAPGRCVSGCYHARGRRWSCLPQQALTQLLSAIANLTI